MTQSKISFALGASNQAAAPTSSDPMSNMERLLAQSKPKQTPKSKAPTTNLFDDEDDNNVAQPPPSLAGPSKPRTQIKTTTINMSRAEKRAQQEALRVDAMVFDYDGVYDGMKAAERQVEQAKKSEDAERKPKYIENFLASAQTRRLDRLRAEEKMLQLEREKEGDEFVDKEKFVTEAYKKQMEEVRQAEEEEKAREDALRKNKKGPGLTSFYKDMLDGDAKKHAAAVAAANGAVDSGPSLAIRPPTQSEEFQDEAEYDPMLAKEEKDRSKEAGTTKLSESTGKEVDINDDGDIVDKRSLLKAGLNIMKKPPSALPNSLLTGQRSGANQEGPYKSRAVGTAASYQERVERERKRLADQMAKEQERKRVAEDARAREEEEAARRRREGDGGEADRKRAEARERAAERKRAKDVADSARKKPKIES